MVVVAEEDLVNHVRTTSRNEQASRYRHCCASRMIEVDGQSSQRMHLSEYPNEAWTSRALVGCKLVSITLLIVAKAINIRRRTENQLSVASGN